MGGWLHNLDPILFELGPLPIRWYGLSYVTGFAIGALLLRMLAARRLIAIPKHRVMDALLWLIIGVMVGGRIGYCLLYRPAYLVSFEPGFPFWVALDLTKGGMASHGGMIGVALAAWRVSRGFRPFEQIQGADPNEREGRCHVFEVIDSVILAAPAGLLLGRVANFINGELLGKIVAQPADTETMAPAWSVRFPQEVGTGHGDAVVRTPAQEDELFRIAIESYGGFPEGLDPEPTQMDITGLLWPAVMDRLHAGGTDAADLAARLGPLISARHPSQLYQAAAEGLLVGLVVWLIAMKRRTAGVVTAWFLVAYGSLRVVTEFFRLPDDHFGGGSIWASARPLGLSRGQWLSVLMVVAGLAGLAVIRKLDLPKHLGWAGKREPADA